MKLDARGASLTDLHVTIVDAAGIAQAMSEYGGIAAVLPHPDGSGRFVVGPIDHAQCALKVIERDRKRSLSGDTSVPGIGQAQRRAYRVIGRALAQARFLDEVLRQNPEVVDPDGTAGFSVPTHGRGTEQVKIRIDGIDAVGGWLYGQSMLHMPASGTWYGVGWGRRKADDGGWEYSTVAIPINRGQVERALDEIIVRVKESAPARPEPKTRRKKAA